MQLRDRGLESQVDDLLVAEFQKNQSFVDWFCAQISNPNGPKPPFRHTSVTKSPKRQYAKGQTDIGLEMEGTGRHLVLIENKVRSGFMEEQPERYRAECDGWASNGKFDTAHSVLVAPARYLERASAQAAIFDFAISYEMIEQRMGGSAIIAAAIADCEAGWIAEAIPAVSANFEGYRDLARRAYPELLIKTRAGGKPTQSRTVYFDVSFSKDRPSGVPRLRLLHQWQEGSAKLLFDGWGARRHTLGPVIERELRAIQLRIDPNRSKSLGVMLPTPVMDNHLPFGDQKEQCLAGLASVAALRRWYLANQALIAKWVALA